MGKKGMSLADLQKLLSPKENAKFAKRLMKWKLRMKERRIRMRTKSFLKNSLYKAENAWKEGREIEPDANPNAKRKMELHLRGKDKWLAKMKKILGRTVSAD